MLKKVLIILTDGFEEIEAVTPIDILRRAGFSVTVAGLEKKEVKGSHGIRVIADCLLSDISVEARHAVPLPDAILFPGGPGAEALGKSQAVKSWIEKMRGAGRIVGAICAAPAAVLAPTGILEGKKATCFPGYEKRLGAKAVFSSERVVTDGDLVTSRGPGTAMEFSLELVRKLAGPSKAAEISGTVLARP